MLENRYGFKADCLSRFATQLVRRRLANGAATTKDMMQAHINSGMNEEELIQQAFISMYVFKSPERVWY